jgi:hypothetical protein
MGATPRAGTDFRDRGAKTLFAGFHDLRYSRGKRRGFSLQAAEDAIKVRLKAELHALWWLFKGAVTKEVNDSFRVRRLSFSPT